MEDLDEFRYVEAPKRCASLKENGNVPSLGSKDLVKLMEWKL